MPSSSTSLVKAYKNNVTFKERRALKRYTDVSTLATLTSIRHQASSMPLDGIHDFMRRFSRKHALSIVTPPLDRLVKTLHSFGGNAKVSGAGGGDCVIGFFDTPRKSLQAKNAFTDASYPIIEIGGVKSE
mgnify:CR=1 FL=1